MDNGMESMLDTYLFETNSLLERLDELLIEAEKAGDFTTDNVNEIFRIMHTIKGSSAMMEFNSLMTIAHNIEDLFYHIRENGIEQLTAGFRQDLFDLMFRSTDYLRSEVEKVENNQPLTTNIDSFADQIKSFLDKISGKLAESSKETVSETENLTDPFLMRIYFDDGIGMENLRAYMLIAALDEEEISNHHFPMDLEGNLANAGVIAEQGFLLGFPTKAYMDRAKQIIKQTASIHTYEILREAKEEPKAAKGEGSHSPSPSHPAQKEGDVKTALPSGSSSGHTATGAAKQSLISVNLSKLDSLMAIVGEIVITESMVTSSPELKDLKLDSFLKSSRQLRKLTDELQDIAMSLRMVPISGVFQKMNRIIRDMKRDLNKDVKLEIIGENTEVDKTIVDCINDPIMHIVRNAMDHGIEESSEEREAAGKPARGTITLSAEHTGSEVIITISDDGRGMLSKPILATAAKNGLLTKPEGEYSRREVLSLLMLPGFSTNEAVTEFSGRGVGMDVVKKNVEAVGGTILLTSEEGHGSCVTLKIPLTLAIVDGMEVSVGDSIFTIPISNINQAFKVTTDDVFHDSEGNEIIKRMGDYYPVIRLHNLYHIKPRFDSVENGILLWVESGEKSYCLFLDELLGEQQVVVKPLPSFLYNFDIKNSGITGCTIMGDGNISIILDIASLYEAAIKQYQ